MTFCVGWIDRGNVFLVADAVAIQKSKAHDPTTSFGQLHQEALGGHSEECLIKVAPISSHAAVAGSGDLGTISRSIDFLLDTVKYMPVEACLQSLNASLGPFGKNDQAELIVAAHIDGEATLINWRTDGSMTVLKEGMISCGSLDESLIEMPTKMIREISRIQEVPVVRLLAVISSLQSLGTHENTVEQGVGGAFHGLYIDAGGYHWQPDARFLIYGPLQNSSWAATAIRDNALVIHSQGNSGPYCFTSSAATGDWRAWANKWFEPASRLMSSDDFSFWVFISRQWMFTTIVYWHPEAGECLYFRLLRSEDGSLDLRPTIEFADFLEQPAPKYPPTTRPFAVAILNGETPVSRDQDV